MSIDIVAIGDQLIEYPEAKEENFEISFDEYLTIAKKTIRTFAARFRPGLVEQMMKSDDAISNVATAIMMADWRWSSEYKSSTGKVRTKYCYRNQCAIWAIQAYVGRQAKAPRVDSLDRTLTHDSEKENSLSHKIPSKDLGPQEQAESNESKKVLDKILNRSGLTNKQDKYIKQYHMEGLTYQQIADQVGSTREAVRQIVDRAMSNIRQFGDIHE